jgi:hypothetical protein
MNKLTRRLMNDDKLRRSILLCWLQTIPPAVFSTMPGAAGVVEYCSEIDDSSIPLECTIIFNDPGLTLKMEMEHGDDTFIFFCSHFVDLADCYTFLTEFMHAKEVGPDPNLEKLLSRLQEGGYHDN